MNEKENEKEIEKLNYAFLVFGAEKKNKLSVLEGPTQLLGY